MAELSAARDRAIEVIAETIYDLHWTTSEFSDDEPKGDAESVVDALLAHPEVLRALAGVPSRDAVVEEIAAAMGHWRDAETPDCADADTTLGCTHAHESQPGCGQCGEWDWPCKPVADAADRVLALLAGEVSR